MPAAGWVLYGRNEERRRHPHLLEDLRTKAILSRVEDKRRLPLRDYAVARSDPAQEGDRDADFPCHSWCKRPRLSRFPVQSSSRRPSSTGLPEPQRRDLREHFSRTFPPATVPQTSVPGEDVRDAAEDFPSGVV